MSEADAKVRFTATIRQLYEAQYSQYLIEKLFNDAHNEVKNHFKNEP